MSQKTCSNCGKTKEYSEFGKKTKSIDGYMPLCKSCRKLEYIKNRDYYIRKASEYQRVNREHVKIVKNEYYNNNRDKILNESKIYRNNNKESASKYYSIWYQENKCKMNKYHRNYRKNKRLNDNGYRARLNLHGRMFAVMNYSGTKSNNSMTKMIGCSKDSLKKHLELQFKEGMSWDNYGKIGWHIDHIRPCASFDLTDPEQQKQCFHYTNLQPLWAEDNLRKSDKLDWTKEEAV